MKILLTGAGGNIGKGLVPLLKGQGHDLVLSDLNLVEDTHGFPFHQLDIQSGFGLDAAAAGCEMILHTPAWHGIHWREKTEADFWRLNVDGTFWAFQAAQSAGIQRFVFLSSQAWHGHYDKYGFTKRIGEELCEYNRLRHGVRYVSIRPADLTPYGDAWVHRYGTRLLYGGVDRDDVLQSVVKSVARLSGPSPDEPEGIIVDALRPNAFTEDDLVGWEDDPIAACERIFPGSAELVRLYEIDIRRRPHVNQSFLGWEEIGYQPQVHFGAFLAQLRALHERGEVAGQRCPY